MTSISFRERAKWHQIKFREEVLKVGYNGSETILNDLDAQKGLIFFDGFKIYEASQERYPHYRLNQACFANLVRSEHIPFNFFIPLSKKPEYARAVLNRFLGGVINMITDIRIDYAPHSSKALFDNSSFDVFIEYKHASGGYGILCIDVKYAEREYRLMKDSREEKEVNNETSVYNTLTEKTGLYRKEKIGELKTGRYRQVWRNHLLGESMIRKNNPESRFEYFTSILFYPDGNDHIRELIPEYKILLTSGYENSLIGITYEEFLKTARGLTEDTEFLRWLKYLEDRYIVRR